MLCWEAITDPPGFRIDRSRGQPARWAGAEASALCYSAGVALTTEDCAKYLEDFPSFLRFVLSQQTWWDRKLIFLHFIDTWACDILNSVNFLSFCNLVLLISNNKTYYIVFWWFHPILIQWSCLKRVSLALFSIFLCHKEMSIIKCMCLWMRLLKPPSLGLFCFTDSLKNFYLPFRSCTQQFTQ